jgi:GT2 family glycosyltransferase
LLDADDFWFQDYLAEQVALYDERGGHSKRVGVVACDARILGPSGFLPYTYMEYVKCPDDVGLRELLVSNPIYGSALTTRAAVDEVGGFTTFAAVDHDLWLRLVELEYRVVVGRRALAVYRVGSTSVSSNAARMARYEARVYERALARGNLNAYERRLARRALRKRHALERILGEDGASFARIVKALPLLAVVALENPQDWHSVVRIARGGLNPLTWRFQDPAHRPARRLSKLARSARSLGRSHRT